MKRMMYWLTGAALLALLTGILIIWLARHTPTPSMYVVSPVVYSQGTDTYRPGDGRTYVIVEVEIKNPTDQPFHFAPVVQTYLADANGNRYEMAPTELTNPIAAGVIAPGETKRGQLSYNVPLNVDSLIFHFVTNDAYDISYQQPL